MQKSETYNVNQDCIRESMFLKKSFYLDICLFKDLYIGYILSNIENLKTYDKFYTFLNSDNYKYRLIDNKDFWDKGNLISLSHNDLIQKLNDKEFHDKLFEISPNTDIINLLKNLILKSLEDHNILNNEDEIIHLTVNIYPLKLSNVYIDILKNQLEKILLVKCQIINKSYKRLVNENLTKYDCWLIYDFNQILDQNPLGEKEDLSNITALQDIMFLTPRLTHDETLLNTKTREEIEKDFTFCEQYLNIFFEFSFIDPPKLYIE